MKNVGSTILVALRITIVCAFLFGAVYPFAVLCIGRAISPKSADGSLDYNGRGQVIGSKLIAQSFTGPGWFWPRPSAVDYKADASGGSNLAPTNPALKERVQKAIAQHLAAGDVIDRDNPLPLELALASGSGLDPDITVDAARSQIPRVARARNLSEESVTALLDANLEGRLAQTLTGAAPTVNVLRLNLALERLTAEGH
ncbi:MAG: potassium-transporting ATPase subunit KdpC [Nitrospirales bacterium]